MDCGFNERAELTDLRSTKRLWRITLTKMQIQIQALAACILDTDTTPAAFSLIVTTKACIAQWAEQIKIHFGEVSSISHTLLFTANLF